MSIALPPKVYLACGITDMRNGLDGLAGLVQEKMSLDVFESHAVFVFRGKQADRVKLLWSDGQGLCLFYKRLETGKFIWPVTENGRAQLTKAQLSMLLEGIDWRRPIWSDKTAYA
jgi:transposase